MWGSTYLGIRVVVDVAEQPPLFPTGVRFMIAGTVLAIAVASRKGWRALRVPLRAIAGSVLLGFLFLFCGVGMVTRRRADRALWSRRAPGCRDAAVGGPDAHRLGRERPAALTWVGTVIGLGGIAVLARPGTQGDVELWGVLLVLFATVCWAFGVFITPRLTLPTTTSSGPSTRWSEAGSCCWSPAPWSGEFADFSVPPFPPRDGGPSST